jgi:hypothetical protein
MALYAPFVASVATRFLISSLCRPARLLGRDDEPSGHSDSLAYTGMSGDFSGTVVTLFVRRDDVRSSLPPELTIVENDELPDWLRQRDDHPVILLAGRQANLGKRKLLLGRYRTVPLFRPYLETFLAVPFLKPRASQGPSPCFHFVRVPCETFWPTETGILCMGWPKIQCPMQVDEQDRIQHYSIKDERGVEPLLSVETDLTDPVPLDPGQDSLDKIISMLSQPLVLINDGTLLFFRFDLRFEAAALSAVSASGTIYPGLLPALNEPRHFASPKITDVEFGAFSLKTTFMNRLLEKRGQDSFSGKARTVIKES